MKLFKFLKGYYKKFHFRDRDDFFDKYITVRNYLNKGHAEFYWLKGIMTMVLIPSAWLKIWFPKVSLLLTIIAFFVIFITWFCIGMMWDKWKLFHREKEWFNKRDPTLQQIKNNTKRKV